MHRTAFSIALTLTLALCTAAWAIDPIPPAPVSEGPVPGQYSVHIKVLRTGNDGSKAVLAEPTLVVPANRPASFRSGGWMAAADEQVPVGTAARLTISRTDDGQVQVVGMVEVAEIVDRGNGVLSRHSDEAYFKKSVALGKTSRLPLISTPDATQWIELTVKPHDSLAAGRASVSVARRANRATCLGHDLVSLALLAL